MRWLKRDIWKVDIALAGLLLLLVLMVWVPVSSVGASERTSELAIAGPVQATPTVDVTATMTALNEEKLRQEIQQLKNQNGNQNNWLVNNSTALIAAVATVVVALFGILQWAITVRQAKDKDLRDREDERQKEIAAKEKESNDRQAAQNKDLRAQAEERFKTAVTALGSGDDGTQVGGAILLRSFLNPEDKEIYGRYYTQIFDLVVAHLRLLSKSGPQDSNIPLPLNPLRLALIALFKDAFPLARNWLREHNPKNQFDPQSLVASHVNLDNAYLRETDLEQIWMPEAFLRNANLSEANLSEANLSEVSCEKAILTKTNLSGANLINATLRETGLWWANLRGANLGGALFFKAKLPEADLGEAHLIMGELTETHMPKTNLKGTKLTLTRFKDVDLMGADLSEADLTHASFENANLREANLQGSNLSEALIIGTSLYGADLRKANLSKSFFTGAYLRKANFRDANLQGANLVIADLNEADFNGADLSGAKLFWADLDETERGRTNTIITTATLNQAFFDDDLFLKDTNLRGVKGLTKEQLAACKAKGAIVDDGSITDSSQPTASPPAPAQSNDAQAQSTTPAQMSTPSVSTDGSSSTSVER